MNNSAITSYNDRKDIEYLNLIENLLSERSLIENCLVNNSDNNKVVRIKFCGLSAMTLLGGNERDKYKNPAYNSFIDLLSNYNGIISRLNNQGIAVQINLIFTYPFTDFYYDLMQAEYSIDKGCSISCVIQKKAYSSNQSTPKKLDYSKIEGSPEFNNLKQSIITLNESVNRDVFKKDNKIQNNDLKNHVKVRFTPKNGLCCFLQINNTIFLDSYLYAKEEPHNLNISLISPIIKIKAEKIGKINQLDENLKKIKHKEVNQQHYYSALSHFRYLWYHELTLDFEDVINLSVNPLTIRPPHLITYNHKACRLSKKLKQNEANWDFWKQTVKDEFLKYTSKFFDESHFQEEKVTVFLVGSWVNNYANQYMASLKTFIDTSYSKDKNGLTIEAIIFNVEDGQPFQESLYKSLRNTHAACVIQTPDIEGADKQWYSRPNVLLEKGYLLHHLGRYKNYKGEIKEKIFTFLHKDVKVETDNINTGYSKFSDIKDFEYLYFRVIYKLWEILEINSFSTLELLKKEKQKLQKAKKELMPNLEHLSKINTYLSEIGKKILEIEAYNSIHICS